MKYDTFTLVKISTKKVLTYLYFGRSEFKCTYSFLPVVHFWAEFTAAIRLRTFDLF